VFFIPRVTDRSFNTAKGPRLTQLGVKTYLSTILSKSVIYYFP
jgi:hypothetical protein